jgi:hypothetical protein
VSDHVSGEDGGGIFNNTDATLTVANSILSGNSATEDGGGIFNVGTLTVNHSTVSGNSAGYGGGISSYEVLTVTNSTLSGNSAIDGGGILSTDELTVTNSTLSGNSAIDGGGIFNSGTLTMTHSTLSGNSAEDESGGILSNNGTATVTNSLFVKGTDGPNCGGFSMDASNLVDDATCGSATQKTTAEITLDPILADNGGPTFTHALLAGSHAIDFNAEPCAVATDQRGVARPQGAACDTGAYEAESGGPLIYVAAAAGTADNDT